MSRFSSILRAPATAAILFAAACASSGGRAETVRAPVAPDTSRFVVSGDTFFVVVKGDTTDLFRIADGDTSYISRGVTLDNGRDSGAVAIAIPMVVPDPSEPAPEPDAVVEQQRTEPDTLPIRHPAIAAAFAEHAANEISEFLSLASSPESPMTPLDWLRNHHDYRMERPIGRAWYRWRFEDLSGRWCARASRRVRTGDGRVSLSRIYFFPPRMPESRRLPGVSDSLGRAFATCPLGSIRVETEIAEDTDGDSLAAELQDALAAELGPGAARPRPPPFDDDNWTSFAIWTTGPDDRDTVVAGFEDRSAWSRVLAGAWTPAAGLDLPDRWPSIEEMAAEARERVEALARLGRLDRGAARRLLTLAMESRTTYAPSGASMRVDSVFIDELASWFAPGRSLEPKRRAAALLIADQALTLANIAAEFARPDSARIRRRLLDLGATLEHIPAEGYHYRYVRDWLLEAYRLAPHTPVGDRAFAMRLAIGFDPALVCETPEEYHVVIEHGEAWLASLSPDRPVDPEVLAEVHRLVALAYADIVAAGEESNSYTTYITPSTPEEVAAARRRAVSHYQAALQLVPSSPEAAVSWREAWRLAAGLPPLGMTFVCTWD